jgi:hypothetical protein
MSKTIVGPLQEFGAQPGSVKRFSVPDCANPAASLIVRDLLQPSLKVWPHNDVPPFSALCFGRNDSLGVEFYFSPLNLLNFRSP